MDQDQKKHIRNNLVKLINATANIPVLLAYLYAKEIISKSMKQIIESRPDETTKIFDLYTETMKSCCYDDLIECLIESENLKAANILKSLTSYLERHPKPPDSSTDVNGNSINA